MLTGSAPCGAGVAAGGGAPCISKRDGEASVRALREELLARAGGGRRLLHAPQVLGPRAVEVRVPEARRLLGHGLRGLYQNPPTAKPARRKTGARSRKWYMSIMRAKRCQSRCRK